MSERFDIEEILSQDESGVRYRAVDRQTASQICLRRFFPFGLDGGEGGGMEAHECDEYLAAVAEIVKLKQPGLRPVLDGGCDPVDGIPYLVFAWAEGEPLGALCARGEFDADAVVSVMEQAMDVCDAVSTHIGAEALWVDTSLDAIVMDCADNRQGVTFELSPIRWLVDTSERRSMVPLATLAEELMGWRGRLVPPQTSGGLGSWIKWLRGAGRSRSLAEARAMLLKFTGKAEPVLDFRAEQVVPSPGLPTTATNTGTLPSAPGMPAPAAAPKALAPPQKSKRTPWIIAGLTVAVLGVCAWIALRDQPATSGQAAATAAPTSAEDRRLAEINAKAARLSTGAAGAAVLQATDTTAIRSSKGSTLSIEGEVSEIKSSNSGDTLYLIFTGGAEARGRVIVKNTVPGLSENELKTWVGKRVRLTGKVTMEGDRPEVTLADANSITEAK